MTVKATVAADGRSTYAVTVSFYDEDGDAVEPTAIHWSLVNTDNEVINHREHVAVALMAQSITIALYGDDLAVEDAEAESEVRRLVVAATYNSTLGTGLPLVGVLEFRVLNTWAAGRLPSLSPSASASPS
jgi:hypothetical protein